MDTKITLRKIWLHTKTVMTHKKEVFNLACIAGIPIQGFFHDMSKFSPDEFIESVRFCDGHRSPIKNCRDINGVSFAWLHHKAHNKHHNSYWIDDLEHGGKCILMPYKYALEMAIDMIAASKTYNKGHWNRQILLDYWEKEKNKKKINENTKNFISALFSDYAKNGDTALKKNNTKKLFEKYCPSTSAPYTPAHI